MRWYFNPAHNKSVFCEGFSLLAVSLAAHSAKLTPAKPMVIWTNGYWETDLEV